MALPLRLVAYVNGVRFWISDVSIGAPGDDLPEFSFGVPAVPEWTLLPERSHVAIFFSDPVTKQWRLLIEGETAGWNRQRHATGVRRMSIRCRALHAFWETTRYANACGAAQDTGQQTGIVDLLRQAQLNGVSLEPSENAHYNLASLSDMIAESLDSGTRVSAFFMALLPRITLQTPVECFYAQARGISKKMFAFQDKEIVNAGSQYVFKSLLTDKLNACGLGPMDPIKTIYARYEGAIFYRHTGILAPPIYANSVMPELIFLPDLYNVVPPACNVIFRDQLQASNPERDFAQEPTRVVGMLQYGAGNGALPPYYLITNTYESAMLLDDPNTPANGVSPGMAMSHGALTEQELISGVKLHHVRLPFEKVTQTGGDASKPRLSTYIDAAMRHAYSVERGSARVSIYHCSFLPYVQPGFPCLIEDGDMPIHGFIDRVEHMLSSESQPVTMVTVSQIREAFQVDGRNRTAPLPTWLNAKFLPANIDKTYQELFGPNQGQEIALPSSGAMLPGSRITTQTMGRLPRGLHADQVDMDALAGQVLPVPKYSAQYQLQGPVSAMCIADRLRASADPQTAMLAYQYRAGTSLWQYSTMHHLDSANAYLLRPDAALYQQVTTTDDTSTVSYASIDPPEDLSPTTARNKDEDGHPCFGHPLGLKMSRNASDVPVVNHEPGLQETQYGVYDLVAGGFLTRALISPQRQIIARMIAAALKNGISST